MRPSPLLHAYGGHQHGLTVSQVAEGRAGSLFPGVAEGRTESLYPEKQRGGLGRCFPRRQSGGLSRFTDCKSKNLGSLFLV